MPGVLTWDPDRNGGPQTTWRGQANPDDPGVDPGVGGGAGETNRIPLATVTTKGDLIVGTGPGAVTRLGVGADGSVAVADAAEPTGIRWATIPANGTLIGTYTPSASLPSTAGLDAAGDYWLVGTAGTLGQPFPGITLQAGDEVVALVAAPAAASDWYVRTRATAISALTLGQVIDAASTVPGTVTGQRLQQAVAAHERGVRQSFADEAARLAYVPVQADIDQAHLFAQLDSGALYVVTGTVGAPVWAARGGSLRPAGLLTAAPAAALPPGDYSTSTAGGAFSISLQDTAGAWNFYDATNNWDVANLTIAQPATGLFTDENGLPEAGPLVLNTDGLNVHITRAAGGNWIVNRSAKAAPDATVVPALTQAQVEDPASVVEGTVTGQRLAQATVVHQRGVHQTFADAAERTAYTVTAADIAQARVFAQADTGGLWVATGTVGAPVWQARGGIATPALTQPQVADAASTVQGTMSGQRAAEAVAAHESGISHTYANAAARTAQTGRAITQADIDKARVFADGDTGLLWVATGTPVAVVWAARGGAVRPAGVLTAAPAQPLPPGDWPTDSSGGAFTVALQAGTDGRWDFFDLANAWATNPVTISQPASGLFTDENGAPEAGALVLNAADLNVHIVRAGGNYTVNRSAKNTPPAVSPAETASPDGQTSVVATNSQLTFNIAGVPAAVGTLVAGVPKWDFAGIMDPAAYQGTAQTIAQRDALVATDPTLKKGYIVYVVDGATDEYQVWTGAAWVPLRTDVAPLVSLSGMTSGSTNLGTFTGATIPDNATNKSALQALETAVEAKANASAIGIAATATSLGALVLNNAAYAPTDTVKDFAEKTFGQLAATLGHGLADAKGDLIAATGPDAFVRLPVGTNGQALVADSAEAAGVKWASVAGADAIQTLTATGAISAWGSLVLVNSATAVTATLPAATLADVGKTITVKCIGVGAATVAPNGTNTITGQTVLAQNAAVTYECTAAGVVQTVADIEASMTDTPMARLTAISTVSQTGGTLTFDAGSITDSQSITVNGSNQFVIAQAGAYRVTVALEIRSASGNFETTTFNVLRNGTAILSRSITVAEIDGSGTFSGYFSFDRTIPLSVNDLISFSTAGGTINIPYKNVVIEQLVTATRVNPGTVPVTALAADVISTITDNQITTNSTAWVDVTGGSFTLPNIGTYDVEYTTASNNNLVGAATMFRLVRNAGTAEVDNSFSTVGEANGAGNQGANTVPVRITTTSANEAYRLQWRVSGGQGSLFNNGTLNAAGGRSYIRYGQRAAQSVINAGALPVDATSNSFVRASAVQSALAVNTPVVFGASEHTSGAKINWITSSRVEVGAGRFKLRGAVPMAFGLTNFVRFQWFDVTANAFVGSIQHIENVANGGNNAGGGVAEHTATSAGTRLYELRVCAAGGTVTSINDTTLGAPMAWASVDELPGASVAVVNPGTQTTETLTRGTVLTIADAQTTASLTWVDVVGGGIPLPKKGTFEIDYNVSFGHNATNGINFFRLVNSAGTEVPGSITFVQTYLATARDSATGRASVTIPAAETYRLQRRVNTGTQTIYNATGLGDQSASSTITWAQQPSEELVDPAGVPVEELTWAHANWKPNSNNGTVSWTATGPSTVAETISGTGARFPLATGTKTGSGITVDLANNQYVITKAGRYNIQCEASAYRLNGGNGVQLILNNTTMLNAGSVYNGTTLNVGGTATATWEGMLAVGDRIDGRVWNATNVLASALTITQLSTHSVIDPGLTPAATAANIAAGDANNYITAQQLRAINQAIATLTPNTVATTETVVARFPIAAGAFKTGENYIAKLQGQVSAAAALTFRIRFGTAGTTADALLCTFAATGAGAANQYVYVDSLISILSATTATASGSVQLANAFTGPATAAFAAATVNPAAANFLTITLVQSAAQTFTPRAAKLSY